MAFHQQLLDLSRLAGNNVCAECPERNPTHASLLRARGAPCIPQALGVFVCSKCYKHHFRLGIAQVQPLEAEWTHREVMVFRRTGNDYVNSFLEAELDDPQAFENDKEIITFDEQEEAKLRNAFVKNKYVLGKYYCSETYEKMNNNKPQPTKAKATKSSSAPSKLQSTVERNCKESGDVPQTPRGQRRSRRRSSLATRRDSNRALVAHMQQTDALLGDNSEEDEEEEWEADFSQIDDGSDHSSDAVIPSGSNLDRLRAKSLKAQQQGKLDNFLGMKAPAPGIGRRCQSVVGTADTTPQPRLHSDLVYEGKVDVSIEEIRAARDAKKAARRQKRQSERRTSMSASERRPARRTSTTSPQGVREIKQEQQSQPSEKRMARRASTTTTATARAANRQSARDRIRGSQLKF